MVEYVLVQNGQQVPCHQASGEWLQAAPRGAYTTARTVHGDRVFKLSSHVQRLADSANLMAAADAATMSDGTGNVPGAPPHLQQQQQAPLFRVEQLRPAVVSSMAAATRALVAANSAAGGAVADGCASGGKDGGGVGDGATTSGNGCGSGGSGGGPGLGESKLTVLLTWAPGGVSYDVWCHAQALGQRPAPPIKLQILGMPRSNAKAKDSDWVRQRRSLEQARAPGVEEVVLQGDGGQLLEGLSSNFYVLQDGAVVTAEEGVLSGTVRELVLQVCREQGVPVQLRPPLVSEVASWQGVFISSTSRLLLPVHELLLPASAASSLAGVAAWLGGGSTDQGGGVAAAGQGCLVSVEGDGGGRGVGGNGPDVRLAFSRQHPLLERLEAAVLHKVLDCSEPM